MESSGDEIRSRGVRDTSSKRSFVSGLAPLRDPREPRVAGQNEFSLKGRVTIALLVLWVMAVGLYLLARYGGTLLILSCTQYHQTHIPATRFCWTADRTQLFHTMDSIARSTKKAAEMFSSNNALKYSDIYSGPMPAAPPLEQPPPPEEPAPAQPVAPSAPTLEDRVQAEVERRQVSQRRGCGVFQALCRKSQLLSRSKLMSPLLPCDIM